MDVLIFSGAGLSLIGVAGLIACIIIAARAKRAGLGDAELRERLRRVITLNLVALLVSALGLMGVVAGIMLG
ncbi:MAG: hypothetical protein ACK5IB_04760 [Qingshengfaniella sp.]